MAIKPIVTLKETESIQHHTGTLDKQISYQDLVKHWRTYVYTHPTFYKNAEELKHSLSLNSGNIDNAMGTKVRLQNAQIKDKNGNSTGETIVLAVSNGESGSERQRAVSQMRKILQHKAKQIASKPNAAPKAPAKRTKK